MTPDPHELIGYLAAFLTTVSFLPQALKSWRSRNLAGVSLLMYSMFTAGVALWLAYGFFIGSWPVILANAVTFVLAAIVLTLKLIHK